MAEFAYFWDSGYGATTWPTFVDTDSTFNYDSSSDYARFALAPGDAYHVVMTYTAANQTVVAAVTNFEQTAGVRIMQLLNTNFADFRLGAISISSYSDAGQDPHMPVRSSPMGSWTISSLRSQPHLCKTS